MPTKRATKATKRGRRIAKEEFGIKISKHPSKEYAKGVKHIPSKDYKSNSYASRKEAKKDKRDKYTKINESRLNRRKRFYYFFRDNFEITLKQVDKCSKKDKWKAQATMLMFFTNRFVTWLTSLHDIIKQLELDPVSISNICTLKEKSGCSPKRIKLEHKMESWFQGKKEILKSLVTSDAYFRGSQGKNSYQYFLSNGFKKVEDEENNTVTEVEFVVKTNAGSKWK